ncbi:MAG: IPExxxVDY family protein [Bacteroidetes bacterium]|nr:IPExxxVDY family protein [Bacteroidota bacterium]
MAADRKITSEPDRNFKLIGIATPERDYRLCYMLSEALDWELVRLPNHEVELKERSLKMSLSVFRAYHQLTHTTFYLFANKNMGELLLPEAGNFDYLLKMQAEYKGTKDLLKKIKQIDAVLAASEITVKTLKNYARLGYEEPVEKPEIEIKRKGK